MSNEEESYEVIFNWMIENFNENCVFFKVIDSPVFVSSSMDNIHWKLALGVNNLSRSSHLFECRLECASCDISTDKLDCELSIVDMHGAPFQKTEKQDCNFSSDGSLKSLHVIEDVFGLNRNNFLPRDTLTVRCRMRRSFCRDKHHAQPEFQSSRTRIERTGFLWTIEDFCHFQSHQSRKIHLEQNQSKIRILTFEFCFYNEEYLRVKVTPAECCTHIDRSSFKVSILDATRRQVFPSMFHTFVDFCITKQYLVDDKSLYLPMGILSLQVECFLTIPVKDPQDENIQQFSYRDLYAVRDAASEPIFTETSTSENLDACQLEDVDGQCNSSSHREFFRNLRRLHEEDSFSDLYLFAADCVLRAHKSVLSARSPVFRAACDEQSDCIDVPDVDADTLRRMLLFAYSGTLEEELRWYDAMYLYFAAKSYSMEDLKRASRAVLYSSFCATNACEILAHADLYGDRDLKSTAMDFILSHTREIVDTAEWKEFQMTHVKLTAEILYEKYKREKLLKNTTAVNSSSLKV